MDVLNKFKLCSNCHEQYETNIQEQADDQLSVSPEQLGQQLGLPEQLDEQLGSPEQLDQQLVSLWKQEDNGFRINIIAKDICDKIIDEVLKRFDAVEVEDTNTLAEENPSSAHTTKPPHEVIIVDDTDNEMNSDIMRTLTSVYNASNGRIGSDGSGGGTNGELTPASCEAISIGLELNEKDYFCDIGSGGGLTAARIVAISRAKVGIGIETESERHNIAMNFGKWLIEKCPELDCPIIYLNDNINNFETLDGINKAFMYDEAYLPEDMEHIGRIFNNTYSILYIASIKDLPSFGFNVILHKKLRRLLATGGSMGHVFNVFKSIHYNEDSCIWNSRLSKLSDIACNRQKRYLTFTQHMIAVHLSEKSPREAQVRKILGEEKSETNAESAQRLFEILTESDPSMVNGIEYTCQRLQTTQYKRYNEKHLKSGKLEFGALAHRGEKKALITPSFDGNIENGKILISIYYDPMATNGLYYGVVYDLSSRKIIKPVPVVQLLNKFNYLNSIPFDLTDIQQVSQLCFMLQTYFIC